MSDDPQAPAERRAAARALLTSPLLCRELDPEAFALVRRHEAHLDRWSTQRLGYRLHVTADTARLYKTTALPHRRPLRTSSGRPLHQLESVLLLLTLAATVAGPAVVSLRDLVDQVRSAAADAGVELGGDATERRGLVTALRWMIDHGLAAEMHSHVDAYATDATADAVLALRPDRIAMLALPAAATDDPEELLAAADRRDATRAWLRARLVEDPVVYRDELTDEEWTELRRRLGEEAGYLEEMFGLVLEARAEGVAAVDPSGSLTDEAFPGGGTEGHAALLLVAVMRVRAGEWWALTEVEAAIRRLAERHSRHWAKDLVAAPERLARRSVDLLVAMRLAERRSGGGAAGAAPVGEAGAVPVGEAGAAPVGGPPAVRLLPAAARFMPEQDPQDTLW